MRVLLALSTATLCYAATVGKCSRSVCPVSKGTKPQQVFLKQHNYLRQKHQNTPCMTLDSKLNSAATSWAKKMLRNNKMKHATGLTTGENLYMSGIIGDVTEATVEQHVKKAVDMWYAEIKDYDYRTAGKKRGGGAIGHFTQVVWDASTKLGLGYAYGKKNGRSVIYVVGRYSPRGNFYMRGRKKQYYTKHVHRPGCNSPGGEAHVAKAKASRMKRKPCKFLQKLRKARGAKRAKRKPCRFKEKLRKARAARKAKSTAKFLERVRKARAAKKAKTRRTRRRSKKKCKGVPKGMRFRVRNLSKIRRRRKRNRQRRARKNRMKKRRSRRSRRGRKSRRSRRTRRTRKGRRYGRSRRGRKRRRSRRRRRTRKGRRGRKSRRYRRRRRSSRGRKSKLLR